MLGYWAYLQLYWLFFSCFSSQLTPPLLKGAKPHGLTQPQDACDLLGDDHQAVKKMFKAYAQRVEPPGSKKKPALDKKRELANKICFELTVHTKLKMRDDLQARRVELTSDSARWPHRIMRRQKAT